MINQISIVIAIGVATATLLIPAINSANALVARVAPQPILTAGHDQILRGSGGIILKAGGEQLSIIPSGISWRFFHPH